MFDHQANRGFSYLELIFTVAIMAMLATAATPYLEKTVQRKKEMQLRENLREIRLAIDQYKHASDEGKISHSIGDSGYPKHLEDLVLGVPDITDPEKRTLRFLRRIPIDPMFNKEMMDSTAIDISPADTWGKRSYKSDPEYPQEGEDVFDVYSLNPGIGLNGIAYQAW
jgi:general secretion pathway protein G